MLKVVAAGIFGLGTPELLIILVIAVVIFGPQQLPKLGKMFGKTMKEVRTGIDEATQEANAEGEEAPAAEEAAAAPSEPSESGDKKDGCIACGAKLPSADAKFCNECGAAQEKKEVV